MGIDPGMLTLGPTTSDVQEPPVPGEHLGDSGSVFELSQDFSTMGPFHDTIKFLLRSWTWVLWVRSLTETKRDLFTGIRRYRNVMWSQRDLLGIPVKVETVTLRY